MFSVSNRYEYSVVKKKRTICLTDVSFSCYPDNHFLSGSLNTMRSMRAENKLEASII